MSSLSSYADDWNELADVDALWAVLTHPDKRGNLWELDEFFETGRAQITATMDRFEGLGWTGPATRALDFGCGVGRMARPLTDHFDRVDAVDVSHRMIEVGEELNTETPNLTFHVNTEPDLSLFPSERFDFVHTFLVLQHLPSPEIALNYIYEFERILRPGGVMVFDVPTSVPAPHILRSRRRVYRWLRRLGASAEFLHRKGLTAMTMIPVNPRLIDKFVESRNLDVLLVDERATGGLTKSLYYLKKPQ